MADKPDFSKIWASESPLTPYSFADADYLKGWAMVGDIPPDRRMFDALQRLNDTKLKWVSENASLNLRKPSTVYAVGDIAYSALLPSWAYIECTVGGTTSDGDLPVPSSVVANDTFTDGTVTWAIRKIENMANYTKTINAPMFNKRDIITTSGTYTAPVTGWYKITVKGGGGGGSRGAGSTGITTGAGGGEGGTTIAYEHMLAGDTATVVIGAGGTGATTNNTAGADGGNSSVTINGNTYIGGGGQGSPFSAPVAGGAGGSGTIVGCPGGAGNDIYFSGNQSLFGGAGGGAGGGVPVRGGNGGNGTQGGGGAGSGGAAPSTHYNAGNGGNGYVWFEYFDSSLNP